MCGSAKNSSRSCTDNLLSAMVQSLGTGAEPISPDSRTPLPSHSHSAFPALFPGPMIGLVSSERIASPVRLPGGQSPRLGFMRCRNASPTPATTVTQRAWTAAPIGRNRTSRRSAWAERGRRPWHGTSRRLWLGWETTHQPENRSTARMGSRQAAVRGLDHLGPGDSRGLRRDLRGQVRAAGPRSLRRCARRPGRGSAIARVRGGTGRVALPLARTGDRRARYRAVPHRPNSCSPSPA